MTRFQSLLLYRSWILVALGAARLLADGFQPIQIQDRPLFDASNKRVLQAIQASQAPRIDGRLDDPLWQGAAFQSGFLQREPLEGEPATEKTAVALAYDSRNLYIAVRCFDSEPDKIIAREMRRDALVDDDDYLEIVLDTYHDHRSAFYFIMNANGVRRDGMFGDEGRQYNPSWDGVWRCRSRITDQGWQLEIAIPLKTLRFAEDDADTWGINFARMIRRKNEHVYWQLVPRKLGQTNIFRVSEAGNLEGLRNLRMGGNLELKPYVIGGLQNDRDTGNALKSSADLGLDAKVALTGNLSLDLTLNTDFAQVEADQEQVNLTRFSLFYPEKREFFLEGAEVFNFGSGSRNGGDFHLFHSRRIGIMEGQETRILGGAKMVGKVGRVQMGFLNMVTDEARLPDGGGTAPAANYTVLRLKRDLLNRGAIGLMATSKTDLKGGEFNRALGVDLYLPIGRYTTITGYVAGAYGQEEALSAKALAADKNLAFSLSADYRTDRWAFGASQTSMGETFDPAVGYVRRWGYRQSSASASFSPRSGHPAIRQFTYSLSGSYRSDHDGVMLDQSASLSYGIQLQNSGRINLGLSQGEEFLDTDWEVRTGFPIPMDTYTQWRGSASFKSDPSRRLAGSLSAGYGDYYTGTSWSMGMSGTVTLIPRTRLELDYQHNTLLLPQGDVNADTYGLRAFYFFSTELFVKAYVQLKDDKLAYDGREKTVTNLMLRWIYSPGSNLFVVYNDGRLIGPGGDTLQNRAVMAKATFFWRK